MTKKFKNKINIFILLLLVLCMVPSFIFAASKTDVAEEIKTNTTGTFFSLNKKDTYDKSIFMGVYTNIVNEGKINGNVIALTNNMENKGYIDGSVISFSPEFNSTGTINKNLIGFYNNLYLNNATINGDLIVYGDKLITNEKTFIKEDVNVFVDDVLLKGTVNGDVFIVGNSVTINSKINGDVKVGCNELVIGKEAEIEGKLIYESENPIVKTKESKIKGGAEKKDLGLNIPQSITTSDSSVLADFVGYYNNLSKITILIIGLILIKLFPISALKVEIFTRRNVLKCLSMGALTMLIITPLMFILVMTVLGIPVALHLLSLYFNLTYIATIPTALVIGGLFVKGQKLSSKMLTGVFILLALEFLSIGILSSLIIFVFNLIGIGSIVMLVLLYLRFQMKREKTEYITLMSINDSREDIIRTKQKFEQMKSRKFEEAMRKREETLKENDDNEKQHETEDINKKEDKEDE